jgi:hypothetical protein
VAQADWWDDLINCVEVIKADSQHGWFTLMYDYFFQRRFSLFRKVLDSFDDIDYPYSYNNIIRYDFQFTAFMKFLGKTLWRKDDRGAEIVQYGPPGSRKIFFEQQKRIDAYSTEEMLKQVNELANLALAIPMTNWERDENFGMKIMSNCNDYGRLLILGYLMPPTWYLKSKLNEKSWLKILQMAGVIDDKGIRGFYGTRVIAKDGHECNSLAELEIDNWLSQNGILHEKEPLYPYDEELNPNTRYRGDFKIGITIVEYAGLMSKNEYREKMKIKEKLAKNRGLSLVILTAKDLHKLDDVFRDLLKI